MRRIVIAVLACVTTGVLIFSLLNDLEGQRRRSRSDGLAALPLSIPTPADNPQETARVNLGRMLFWDPVLSGNRDVACATCHHPQFGYAENRDLSIGVNGLGLGDHRQFRPGNTIPLVKRNSQTILNVAFNGMDRRGSVRPDAAPMFWDTRVESLEAQALEPIRSFEEMRGDAYPEDQAVAEVLTRLRGIPEYVALFAAAFGGEDAVTEQNLGRALAAFQRSLVAANSPFDRYMRGEIDAMTAQQVRGMRRFQRIGCANCHNGPMFSDYIPHVLSVPDNDQLTDADSGVNGRFAFRTPSLRNLEYTAPYMHNGVFATLEDVVDFYDDVSRGRPRNPNVAPRQLDRFIRRLDDVDENADDLVAFLRALSDGSFDRTIPDRVPSGLSPGGGIAAE